jgi:hypothetical protein
MKIIITESQEKSIKERVIFMLMDKQKLHQIDTVNYIFFVKNIGDEYAKIRFDKSDGKNWIDYYLISELSDLTQFRKFETKQLISSWVENTLQMEVTQSLARFQHENALLRIPYK